MSSSMISAAADSMAMGGVELPEPLDPSQHVVRHEQEMLMASGNPVAFLPVGQGNSHHQLTSTLPESIDKWGSQPAFNAFKPSKPGMPVMPQQQQQQQQQQKQIRKKPQRPIEIIVCKGTETVVPKSRSQGERRYVCNGHTIHRVTFWRHRKHGCPHGTSQMPPGPQQKSMKPSVVVPGNVMMKIEPNGSMEGEMKPSLSSSQMSGFTSVQHPDFEGHHHGHHQQLYETSMDFSNNQMHSRPMDMSNMHGMKAMPVSMSFPMMDGSIDLSMQPQGKMLKNTMVPGMPPMKAHYPGLDAQPGAHMGHIPGGTLPPFSLMPDQLNFVYAPYQPADPDEDDINALTTPYVGPGSPYTSDRSEASDFLDDGDLFNSYLERSNGRL